MVFPTFFNLRLNLAIRSSWFEPRQHIKKQGHHSAVYSKVHIVKSMVFPVFMFRCERWTIKKAECLRTEAFELWCWRRLLRVPCTARKLSQSTLKEFKPQFSLKGLILKLKLQYFGYLMWRSNSLEKTLMLGKIEGKRRRDDIGWDGWMALLTQWTWVWANCGRWWRTGKPGVLQSLGLQRIGHNLVTNQRTTAKKFYLCVVSTRDLISGLLL